MDAMIIIFLITLDQWTKGLAERLIPRSGYVTVIPQFFELRVTYNKGAAWSFLADKPWGIILLCLVSAVITAFLLNLLRKATGKRMRLVLILLIAGSAGNLIDRLRVGAVTDFFSFTFGDYVFPSFNAADSFITVGTALLIAFILFDRTFVDGIFALKRRKAASPDHNNGTDELSGDV